jgi:hypothetical protein
MTYDSIIRYVQEKFASFFLPSERPPVPRPKPAPENTPVRTTISLPRKLHALATRYAALHPEEDLRDFSDIVSKALVEYAARKHPGLLEQCIAEIRAEPTKSVPLYPDLPAKQLKAAENKRSPYGAPAPAEKQNPTRSRRKPKTA